MKKIFNISTSAFLVLVMAAMQFCLTSCKDDSTSGGTPVITSVRVCDPEKADSTFTKSSQGQIIAIIGEHLNNAIYVYINDQKVYFNPTMNTDHSIIVTVPSETNGFKLTAFNSDLKDEIRVETDHGTATYGFKILGGYPSISRVQCEYPRKAGDILNVYGLNLEAIEDIYFTDIEAAELDTTEWETPGGNHVAVTDYKVVVNDHHLNTKTNAYETTSQLAVTIPDLPYDRGSFVVECAAGVAYIAYGKTPGQPIITALSSDMPVIGETLTISGREFVQVESVIYGDVVLLPGEFTVAETEDAITIDFTQIPSEGTDPTIAITTPGGTGKYEFYNRANLLNDFDSDRADMGWDPNALYTSECPFGGTGVVGHFNTFGQWWGQMIFFSHDWDFTPFELPTTIPASTPASEVYFAFEVYDNNSDFNNGGAGYQGFFRVAMWGKGNNNTGNNPDILYDNFAWDNYDEGTFFNPDGPILQDVNGEAHLGKWYRTVIPLSVLKNVDADGNPTEACAFSTYGDFLNNGLSIVRIMSYTQGTKSGNVDVYVDNIRLVHIK